MAEQKAADKLLEKARDGVKKKNFEYAITLYAEYLKAHPEDLDCRKELRAAERLQLKIKGDPNIFSRKKLEFQAQAIRPGKDASAAEKAMISCEEVLKSWPNNITALLKLGEAAAHANHNEVAILAFEDAIGVDKDCKEAYRFLGRVYRSVAETKEALDDQVKLLTSALKCFQRLHKIDPKDKEGEEQVSKLPADITSKQFKAGADKGGYKGLIDKDKTAALAQSNTRIRTEEQALERISSLEETVKKNPRDTKTMHLIAEIYYKHTTQVDEAIAWCDKALKMDPANFIVAELKGTILIDRLNKQVEQLREQVKSNPGLKPKLDALEAKKLGMEIEEYKKRVEAHPTEYALRFDLGKALWDAAQIDEAIPELQKAKADPRKKAEAGYLLGRCFMKKQVYNMAVKEFKGAMEDLVDMDALKKEITYMLGRIYEQGKKTAEARAAYESIAEVDFNYRDVTKRLEGLGNSDE